MSEQGEEETQAVPDTYVPGRDKVLGRRRIDLGLKYAQILLYLGFVFAWFKNGFEVLKDISLSPWPLMGLLALVTIVRGLRKRSFTLPSRFPLSKEIIVLLLLLCLAVLVRMPFMLHSYGLINSDDGIPAIESKHISEGMTRPIYYYGQHYMGSLPFHFYALGFKLFGYSIFLFVLMHVLFHLAFMVTQFLLFKEIFESPTTALLLTSFYVLPLGHLLSMTFYVGANFSVALFMGSLSIYLAYRVYAKNQAGLIPWIGFIMGIAFWTHPITICFSAVSSLLLVLKYRISIKRYLILVLYFAIGVFPVIMYEIFTDFASLKYAFSSPRGVNVPWERMGRIIANLPTLLSMEPNGLSSAYLVLIAVGIAATAIISLRKPNIISGNFFTLFFLVYLLIYAFSRFPTDETKLRYLYPFYFCLPPLIGGVVLLIRSRIRLLLLGLLFMAIFLVGNARPVREGYLKTKQADLTLNEILQAMDASGEKFWAATFWEAVHVSAISGERFVCTSYLHHSEGRYIPLSYRLNFFNRSEHTNYFFLKEAGEFSLRFREIMPLVQSNFERMYQQKDRLRSLLNTLDIQAEIVEFEKFTLVYNAEVPILPASLFYDTPVHLPEITVQGLSSQRGHIYLTFVLDRPVKENGFRIFAEIEGYSSIDRGIAPDKEQATVRIPFPRRPSFEITYGFVYQGIRIPSSQKSLTYVPSAAEVSQSRRRHIYLSGIGPEVQVSDTAMLRCGKTARIEINHPQRRIKNMNFSIYSPFDFNVFFWYRNYVQEIRIKVDSQEIQRHILHFGSNGIEVSLPEQNQDGSTQILTLEFAYHMPFYPCRQWRTAAFLENIELMRE
jgi:hypothetical protein